ncbi:MAG TPA: ribokinase [Ktedonobacterales bacterium]|nr:ribokinase [Ktedonobacterales bacterium]
MDTPAWWWAQTSTRERPHIAVVGSINMDIVNRVMAFPRPGETVRAVSTAFHAGGKGANQAVAAAAAGGETTLIAALGDDPFAPTLRTALQNAGVHVSSVVQKDLTTSGQATITINEAGQNTIVLAPGANERLTPEDVRAHTSAIQNAHVLLVQNEVPWETTVEAMRLAHAGAVPVICNPAPARQLSTDVYALVDTLITNEIEAATLLGQPIPTVETAIVAAHELAARGPRRVIITLGEHGAVLYDAHDDSGINVPAFGGMQVVDTTGAGDTFIGFYAVGALSMPAAAALHVATAAAALAITRPGAQEAVPTADEVSAFLQAQTARSTQVNSG